MLREGAAGLCESAKPAAVINTRTVSSAPHAEDTAPRHSRPRTRAPLAGFHWEQTDVALRDSIPDRLIIAIGGNAIHPEGSRGTAEEQAELAAQTARALLPVMELNTELVITHGNGPV